MPTDPESIRRFLRGVPLFEKISPASPALSEFVASIQGLQMHKGGIVYRQGTLPQSIYLVRDGEIRITAEDNGQKKLIGMQSRGSLFGEVSFLTGESHSSSAEASLDSTLLVIPGPAFFKLLSQESSVGEGLARLLSQRLRNRMRPESSTDSTTAVAVLYPDSPRNGSELCAELGEAMLETGADQILILSWNPRGVFADRGAGDLRRLIRSWPDLRPEGEDGYVTVYHAALEGEDKNKLCSILAGLIALLKKYYAAVIIDPGIDHSDSLVREALEQADRVVLVQSCRDPSVLRSKVFAETISSCVKADSDFFSRAILVTHESPGEGALPHIVEGRFERHLRLRGVSERIEETDRTTRSGVRRIARALLGVSRALCLGGGGARAFAHIGVLEVFEENGIEFDAVAGTSMGAVMAGAYALGLSAEEIEYNVRRILPHSSAILDKTIPLVSFFTGRNLNRTILRFFGDLKFEDLSLPFFCNAVDLNSGKEIVFEKGYLAAAIRASVSIPGVFPPFRHGPYALVDGAVLNNLPGDILKSRGYDIILGVNVSPLEDHRPVSFGIQTRKGWVRGIRDYFSIPPILRIINRSIAIESRQLLKIHMEQFEYLLHPEVSDFDTFDFERKKEIIDAGRTAARTHIGEIKDTFTRQSLGRREHER
ncbi:MAG: patatin-like phospholipase family protein [Leptospirales bacterium]|nr:patatin-like phospholipase family protein [Leptospirales bacterium]HNN57327.1 patatin-like phospholipase family protein [Leptospiraceae bacterium]HNN75172.1 patatin-like phospholipase family protein [Leptospiraceae bacterium]